MALHDCNMENKIRRKEELSAHAMAPSLSSLSSIPIIWFLSQLLAECVNDSTAFVQGAAHICKSHNKTNYVIFTLTTITTRVAHKWVKMEKK